MEYQEFVNRHLELRLLNEAQKKGGLSIVWGRRRVGKTALLLHWLQRSKNSYYSQSIEGSAKEQIHQLHDDLRSLIQIDTPPTTWSDFFQMLDRVSEEFTLVIDEFPYLVKTSPTLPSLMQRWLDHRKHKNNCIILSGSSMHMMENTFLNRESPLFGRCYREILVQPLEYSHFCQKLKLKKKESFAFELFCLVGGLPKYWEFIDTKLSLLENIDRLFFEYSAFLENEPQKLLSDENINGLIPLSVLQTIGRGAVRPSEIASRLGMPQSSLSRTLNSLIQSGFLSKDIPYGEPEKNSKKIQYRIQDQALWFWHCIFSPLRSQWQRMSRQEKVHRTRQFFSWSFERMIRSHFSARRYWKNDFEIDLLFLDEKQTLIVGECKYTLLTKEEKRKELDHLKLKTHTFLNSIKSKDIRYVIYDQNDLQLID